MTHADDADLGRLGESRYNLFKKYLWATNNTQLQQDLTDMAFTALGRRIANPEYHPAFRYNAILVIGMLDEQYANAPGQIPKPLPKATKALTGVVGTRLPTIPKAVFRPGHPRGNHRIRAPCVSFVRRSLPKRSPAMTAAALVKLVTQRRAPSKQWSPTPTPGCDCERPRRWPSLAAWARRIAFITHLVKLVSSTKSLDDRCEAVGLLDKLDKITYKDVKLDNAPTADSLFGLARDVATAEDKRAADFQNQYSGGGTSMPALRGPGPGQFSGIGEEQQETYPRRVVLARLKNLRAALAKVKPALPAETQKKVDDLIKVIDPAITAASDKNTIELKLAKEIRTMAAAVNKAVPAPAAEKAAPAKAAAAL